MPLRYALFFLVLAVVQAAAHRYVWARLVRDTGLSASATRAGTWIVVGLYVLLLASLILFRVLPRVVATPLAWLGYTWLGLLFFLLVALGAADLVRVLATHATSAGVDEGRRLALSRLFGGLAAAAGASVAVAGMASALSRVAVAKVEVVLDKLAPRRAGYRIVQISDVHIGPTIGRSFITEVVERINDLAPDLVVITGDLVDGSVEELRMHAAPLAGLRAKDGVYFVTGNHEYYSGADEWIAHLRSLGIRVLRNERVAIGGDDGFDLAGIDDASSHGVVPGHGPDLAKAMAGRDPARPVVLLAHQPRSVAEAVEQGVDLQLSGHTHGGQMFPWNLLVKLQQPFVAGLHRVLGTQIYVSRGTGYWGPPMRVAAPAEITEILLASRTS